MLASNDQAKEMMKDQGVTGFPATLVRRCRLRPVFASTE
jgi:hypothetical protein